MNQRDKHIYQIEDVAIDDGSEEEAIEAAASSSQPVAAQLHPAPQPPVITPLIRAMRSAGGNQLDVGERMARKMRSETSEKAEESAADTAHDKVEKPTGHGEEGVQWLHGQEV